MRVRPTVRLLLVDEQRRVFLFKHEDAVPLDPAQPELRVYWAAPGGGLEAGETHEQAGLRELWEETGLRVPGLGPWVWTRERTLQLPDQPVRFLERYYLVPVAATEVVLSNMQAYERAVMRDHRWWTLAAIERSDEVFLPPGLARLLAPLLAGQLPDEPLLLYE